MAWQPVAFCDDTLPAVLCAVNKCECVFVYVKCYGECPAWKKKSIQMWSNARKPILQNIPPTSNNLSYLLSAHAVDDN